MHRARNRKILLIFSYWYLQSCKKLNKKNISENVFSQLQYVLLRMLNKKWTAVPVPLTSVYLPLSQKNQRDCETAYTEAKPVQQTYPARRIYCLFQCQIVSSSSQLNVQQYWTEMRKPHVGVQKPKEPKPKQYVLLRTLKVLTRNGSLKQINSLFIIHFC